MDTGFGRRKPVPPARFAYYLSEYTTTKMPHVSEKTWGEDKGQSAESAE